MLLSVKMANQCSLKSGSQHTTQGWGKYLLSSDVNLYDPDTVGLLLCCPSSSSISILSKGKTRNKYHTVSYCTLIQAVYSCFPLSYAFSVSPWGRFFPLLTLPVLCCWSAPQLAEWSETFSPNQGRFAVAVSLRTTSAECLHSREHPRHHFPIILTALEVKCLKSIHPIGRNQPAPGRRKTVNESLLVSGCP